MTNNNFFILALLIVGAVFSATASANVMQVNVPNKVTVLKSNGIKSSLIQVSNPDKKKPRFVRVGVYYIEPETIGTGNEKTIEIKGKLKNDNVIVLPNKVAIPPNGKTNVRVVYTGKDLEEDHNYKIRFYPITEIEYKGGDNKKTEASLFFSISSTTFTTVVKSNPSYNNNIERDKITNQGDSLSLLKNCNICRDDNCKVFSEFRLPPGRQLDFSSAISGKGALTWKCDLVEPGMGTRIIKSGSDS